MGAAYADVILPLPLRSTFTYALPVALRDRVQLGSRVIVPFGAKKFYSAVVLKTHDVTPDYETKDVMELLDEQPIILPQQLSLWQWIADYYLCTLGDVFKAALPSGLKLESESSVMYVDDFEPDAPLSPSEQKVLEALEATPVQTLTSLQKQTSLKNILPVVRHLLEKGAIRMKEEVKRTYKPRTIPCVRVTPRYFDVSALQALELELKRSPRQLALLSKYLELASAAAALALQNPVLLKEVTKAALTEAAGCTPAVFNALKARGVIEVYQKPVARLAQAVLPQELVMHPLSPAQQQAMDTVLEQWRQHDVCLLHGVTSSGKTEIYIHLIQQMLEQGRQVLYMLPEIVLTAQLTDRLKRVFGDRLGVYHSRYPDAERVEVYQKMASDEPYDIIVGVRSSIFLPFKRLGLIIIDEEHETSFKQQDPAPRYHARNAALVLAAQVKAKTLLGTATPSLETYFNALRGKYGLATLTTRYRDIQLPTIQVVNMTELRRKKLAAGPFSPELLLQIRQTLERRQQVILFQNRRGYAPMVECHVCGWVPRCQKCDVSLTLHRSNHQLTCHYCGTSYPVPSKCPNCESTDISHRGYGTERIEDQLQRLFPEARIARMDLDTTRSRQNYEQILLDFQHGRTDILVGTQMVTKGLDFDHVALVGILNASGMLSQPDFRSHERAFHLMEQVAGRAGRKGGAGRVVLQTNDAEAPVVQQVVTHDYRAMYDEQMEERQLFHYPPFCRLVFVYLKHRDERVLESMSAQMASYMRQVFGERVLGPDTPPVGRVQMMHIRKIILKVELSANMAEARQRLLGIQQFLLDQPQFKSGQIYYDVD